MKIFRKSSVKYMEYIRSYQFSYICLYRLTDMEGWVFWTPYFIISYVNGELHFLFDPQDRFKKGGGPQYR